MRIKVVTWITFFIAVSIISFSLYILYSDNSQENEGILGIGIGLLIGYIGIIKNKPDIYEIESQDIDNIIDLNGTKVIISKFNEITDTIEKIFPIQKANNSEPIVIENKNSLQESLPIKGTSRTGIVTGTETRIGIGTGTQTKQQVIPSQKKYSEPLMNILRKNPSADEGINGQRRLVNLFEKFEPAEPKTISRTELNFPKRKNEEIALPIVLPQPTATTQTTQTPSTTTTQTTSTTQTPTTTSTTQAPSTLTTQTT
jgi:hypothetical protein